MAGGCGIKGRADLLHGEEGDVEVPSRTTLARRAHVTFSRVGLRSSTWRANFWPKLLTTQLSKTEFHFLGLFPSPRCVLPMNLLSPANS